MNIYKHKGQIRSPFFNCPIAGQDLVANGGFMQIWGRCLIARTEERRLLKCVGRSELGLKKVYFSIFGNYWGANNHEIVRAQRRTELVVHDSVPQRTPASGWDRLEVHFSVVKMLSTAFFFLLPLWNVVRAGYIHIYATDSVFPVAVIFFCYIFD